MKNMVRTAVVLALLLMLGACAEVKEYVQGDLRKPAELTAIDAAALDVGLDWSVQLEAVPEQVDFMLRPVEVQGVVYVAEARGRIAAHSTDNGKLLWERVFDSVISAGIAVGDELLIVGTDDARLLALNKSDGSDRWQADISSELLAPAVFAGGMVIVHAGDDKVIGISAADGRRVWVNSNSFPVLSLRGSSTPVVWRDLAIVGLASGKLVALDIATGKQAWEYTVTIPRGRTELERLADLDGRPLVDADTLYIPAFQGRLSALSLNNGQLLWARDMSSYRDLVAVDNVLYVTDEFSRVWALDKGSGATIWSQEGLHGRELTGPVVQGEYLVVADFEGYVHWLSRADGSLSARVSMRGAQNRARVLGRVRYPEEDPLNDAIDIRGVNATPHVSGDHLYITDLGGVLAAYVTRKSE